MVRLLPSCPRTSVTALVVFLFVVASRAALPLTPVESLFTNLADRLLVQQLGLHIGEVRVAPTNEYTAAVHRVFQVTANICQAMSTNDLPLVFRPLFTASAEGAFLAGFTNDNSRSSIGDWLASNPYGIPLVIAAKKGLPNFNEYTIQTDALITRKLQLVRPNTNSFPVETNQMYIMGMSNSFFVEAWNSYSPTFSIPSFIEVTNVATITLANASGVQFEQSYTLSAQTNVTAWPGRVNPVSHGFVLPLSLTQVTLSNAVYLFGENRFVQGSTNIFEGPGPGTAGFPVPQFKLTLSNHLVYIHSIASRIVDFVVLDDVSTNDLSYVLEQAPSPATPLGVSVWSTNRVFGPLGPTEGIRGQITFSASQGPTYEWTDYSFFVGDRTAAATAFNHFLNKRGSSLVVETPFNPTARIVDIATWQANDPLVHYHKDDLSAFPDRRAIRALRWWEMFPSFESPASVTNVNRAYLPWGPSSISGSYAEILDPHLQDSCVFSGDTWNFPTSQPPVIDWLGRVHRGTPWQTIYLKASGVWPLDWYRSRRLHLLPETDWQLAALLAREFRTNNTADLLSINSTNMAAWRAVMTGLTVLSNTSTSADPWFAFPTNETITIQPDAPQLDLIVEGIARSRAAQPNGYFVDVAAFLATPELSVRSPWLNMAPEAYPQYNIIDEAYEALTVQLLARVRADPMARIASAADGFTVTFTGCPAGVYTLQVSPDLRTWTDLAGTHVPTNGTFSASVAGGSAGVFVRAVMP